MDEALSFSAKKEDAGCHMKSGSQKRLRKGQGLSRKTPRLFITMRLPGDYSVD